MSCRRVNEWQVCIEEKVQHCALLAPGMTSPVTRARLALNGTCPEPTTSSAPPSEQTSPSDPDSPPGGAGEANSRNDDDDDDDSSARALNISVWLLAVIVLVQFMPQF